MWSSTSPVIISHRSFTRLRCSTQENSIQKELLQIWPDIDYDYLLVCTSELIRYRIIVSSKKDLPKNKQSVFSSFGKKFVEYIFNPIEIKEF